MNYISYTILNDAPTLYLTNTAAFMLRKDFIWKYNMEKYSGDIPSAEQAIQMTQVLRLCQKAKTMADICEALGGLEPSYVEQHLVNPLIAIYLLHTTARTEEPSYVSSTSALELFAWTVKNRSDQPAQS